MNTFSDELRLLWTLLLNGGVFASAYLLARRRGTDGALQAVCDAFLLYFLTQYAAVGLPGAFGVFSARTMSGVAFIAAAAMFAGANSPRRMTVGSVFSASPSGSEKNRRALHDRSADITADAPALRARLTLDYGRSTGDPAGWSNDHFGFMACALFAAGYLGCYAWSQRYIPPIATDALVYHLPTAVQWLQTHRLGIYPSWYWNPAASYSPETGSMFMAWWLAPAGNDVFVRFVQLPPLLFIFFLVARLCRLFGCTRSIAGLIAIAATLSRPLFSEAIFAKDDLYVTAFVAAAVLALARVPMRGRLSPWRVGAAMGLVLASKYTVLLACPIFLFLVDSPFRARWKFRHAFIAIGLILALALPWYMRNIILTGNPLFPVDIHLPGLTLAGLFSTERDQQLRTAGGVWHMLASTYHSLPTALIASLLIGWLGACIFGGRAILREPLPRACVVGSVATLILFLTTSPHHEVRYVFPMIVLLFAAGGFALAAIGRIDQPMGARVAFGLAAGAASVSTITSFSLELISSVATLAAGALLISVIGAGLLLLQLRVLRLKPDRITLIFAAATLAFAVGIYVEWHAYVNDYRAARMIAWNLPAGYPGQAEVWKWVDDNVPADASVAYANTFFVYPYYGFDLTRRVGYAPVRRGLHDFLQFPRVGERVPGDLIVRRMTEAMNTDPDRVTWLENLRKLNAGYLVVMKHDPDNPDLSSDPPELKFARSDPQMFVPVLDSGSGEIFQIKGK